MVVVLVGVVMRPSLEKGGQYIQQQVIYAAAAPVFYYFVCLKRLQSRFMSTWRYDIHTFVKLSCLVKILAFSLAGFLCDTRA